MIQVNQLYITPDSKHLVIDAQIVESTLFSDITFDYIAIDNQNTYRQDSDSEHALKLTTGINGETHIYKTIAISDIGNVTATTDSDGNLVTTSTAVTTNPMLFVYFVAQGNINKEALSELGYEDIPCTWDNTVELEVVCDMQQVYHKALSYIKEMSNNCETPLGFTDFILQYNMLKACLNSGAYNEAIKWWKTLTTKTISKLTTKSCGCHG